MLGFNVDELTLRTQEEMYDPKKLKEVNDAIYSHYIKRYHYKLAQVEAKVEELMNMQKSDRGKLMGQLVGAYGHRGHHRKTRSEANIRLPKISDPPSENHSQGQPRKAPPKSSPHRGFKNRNLVDSVCDSSLNSARDLEYGDNELTSNIMSRYQLKLQNLQEHWVNETKNMINKPANDTNQLLASALKNQVAKISKGIEKAEKYAQSILEAERQKRELEEEIQQKNLRTELALKKIQRSRSETVKKHHELEEEKMKSIQELKRTYNITMRKKGYNLRKRFDALRDTLEKREEEREEVIRAQSVTYLHKVAKAKEQREIQSQVLLNKLLMEEQKSARHLDLIRTERQSIYEEKAHVFEENLTRAKEIRNQLDTQKKMNAIQDLCRKAEETEQIRKSIKTKLLSKAKETAEKLEHHRENYREVVRNKNKWVRSILKGYQKTQEHLQEVEEEKAKNTIIKKELRTFKKQEQEENIAELKRIKEIRDWQIIEKGKTDHLKLVLLREQNNILSQARIDVDRVMKQKMTHLVDSILQDRKRQSPSPKKGLLPDESGTAENNQSSPVSPNKNTSPMAHRSM